MTVAHTFVLPVHNAQHRLHDSVEHLLNDLAERHDNFELMIIDDGSTDDTIEVARDLLKQFPQITVVHRPTRYGFDSAVQTALRGAKSKQVSVAVSNDDLSCIQIRRIEQMSPSHKPQPHFRPLS